MSSTSYKIKIRASVNGAEKVPSKIAWIQGDDSCLLQPCYKENDYLVVELIPGCIGNNCIEGYLMFDDTCSNCEPVHFKRCFCNTTEDCADCEECSAEGLCISKCLQGEYCLDDKCVECDPTKPCPDGKVCINGQCVCPQGSFEKNGRCIECDETTILNKCQECINGHIRTKECDGACDPSTGNCVDCIASGDCYNRTDGRNCCVGKSCECCPGTRWDATLNMCVPQECTTDSDCNDPCMKCTPEGCKEMLCPQGYKCFNGDCVPWDCENTNCNNGADCGPNCGCLNGECVPCAILECTGDCANALGCECKSNNKCGSVGNCDNEYCDGFTPCSDPGCTCYNNKCVSCKNFSCNPDSCSNMSGCGCINGNCDGDGSGGSGCKDSFILEKIEDCNLKEGELKATLNLSTPCSCTPIRITNDFKLGMDSGSNSTFKSKVDVNIKLWKGGVQYNNFSNINIGDNEFISGTFEVIITHKEVGGSIVTLTGLQSAPIMSVIHNEVQPIVLKEGVHYTFKQGNKYYTPIFKIVPKSISIPNNNCINYKNLSNIEFSLSGIQGNSNYDVNIQNYINKGKEESIELVLNDNTSKRKPLFVWFKTATGNISPNELSPKNDYTKSGWFRKVYVNGSGNKYIDKIGLEEGANNNYNYSVKTDCGCKPLQASLDKVIFCNTSCIEYTLKNCNTEVSISKFDNKLMNQNKTLDSSKNPIQSQTKFILSLNGQEQEIFPNSSKTYSLNPKATINNITIKQKYEGSNPLVVEDCLIEETLSVSDMIPDYSINATCDQILVSSAIVGKIQNVKFHKEVSGTDETVFNNAMKDGSVYIINTDGIGDNYHVQISFNDSTCIVDEIVNTVACNPEVKVNIENSTVCTSTSKTKTEIKALKGFDINTIKFEITGTENHSCTNVTSPNNKLPVSCIKDLPAGVYNYVVSDSKNNRKEGSFTINVVREPSITHTDACSGTGASISFDNWIGTNSTITVLNSQNIQVASINNKSSYTFSNLPVSSDTTFKVQFKINGTNSCLKEYLVSIKNGVSANPLTLSYPTGVCPGKEFNVTLQGGNTGYNYNLTIQNGQFVNNSGNVSTTINNITKNSVFRVRTLSGGNDVLITGTVISPTTGICGNQSWEMTIPVINTGLTLANSFVTCEIDETGKYRYTVMVEVLGTIDDNALPTIKFNHLTMVRTPNTNLWKIEDLRIGQMTGTEIKLYPNNNSTGCEHSINIGDLPDCEEESQRRCFNYTSGSLFISASPEQPTCGYTNVDLYYVGISGTSTPGFPNNYQYSWVNTTTGVPVVNYTNVPMNGQIPLVTVMSDNQYVDYSLRLKNPDNCVLESSPITVHADSNLDLLYSFPGVEDITMGSGIYNFSTTYISGATYQWYYKNDSTNGYQSLSGNSNLINVPGSIFIPGNNYIKVIVTVGSCTSEYEKTYNFSENCNDYSVTIKGEGLTSCGNVIVDQLTIAPNTISSWEWFVDNVGVYSSVGPIVPPLEISYFTPDVEQQAKLEITLSNGCTITSNIVTKKRCAYNDGLSVSGFSTGVPTCTPTQVNFTATIAQVHTGCVRPAPVFIEYYASDALLTTEVWTPYPCAFATKSKPLSLPYANWANSTPPISAKIYEGTDNSGTLLHNITYGTVTVGSGCP